MNTTIITSKGTTTIPKKYRDQLNLKPGSRVNFKQDEQGRIYIEARQEIEDLRAKNRAILARGKQSLTGYKSGDGFRAHTKGQAR